jgi:hypothetical protein
LAALQIETAGAWTIVLGSFLQALGLQLSLEGASADAQQLEEIKNQIKLLWIQLEHLRLRMDQMELFLYKDR